MQILRKRMPWRPYLIRLTVLALIMALVGTYAMMRYRIGIDTQQERGCDIRLKSRLADL